MSAFVVSKDHIDALVTEALRPQYGSDFSYYHDGERHAVRWNTADELGQMLWAENVASVEHRYPDSDGELPGKYVEESPAPGLAVVRLPEWVAGYRYPLGSVLKSRPAVEVLKLIDCYEYQSCEHPEWAESEARSFCHDLRSRMIGQLPGYDAAPWGL